MKEPSEKDRREHRDPLLVAADRDIANFNLFVELHGLKPERVNQSGRGPNHTAITVMDVCKVMTEKGELKLEWGYTFETKKDNLEVNTFVAIEREEDMAHLTHNLVNDKWHLRAMVRDSGKLKSLLEYFGIEKGEGYVELKKARYLLAARDLIEYFQKRRDRHMEA